MQHFMRYKDILIIGAPQYSAQKKDTRPVKTEKLNKTPVNSIKTSFLRTLLLVIVEFHLSILCSNTAAIQLVKKTRLIWSAHVSEMSRFLLN